VNALRHELLDAVGVEHGFGVRGLAPPPGLRRPQQVHGNRVAQAAGCVGAAAPRADAVVSALPGVPVGVVTADCVPILVATDAGTAVAAIHAGWRGLACGVVAAAIEALRAESGGAVRLVAAIGPHIGACCYEVDEPVLEALAPTFGGDLAAALRRRGRVTPGSTSAGWPVRRCCAPGSRRARWAGCRAHARAAIRSVSTPTAARAHPPAVSTTSSRRAGPRLDTQGGGALAFLRSNRLRSGFSHPAGLSPSVSPIGGGCTARRPRSARSRLQPRFPGKIWVNFWIRSTERWKTVKASTCTRLADPCSGNRFEGPPPRPRRGARPTAAASRPRTARQRSPRHTTTTHHQRKEKIS